MIVICPRCKKKSKVDETRLPENPIPVSCPHCSLTFYISRKGVEMGTVVPPELPESRMPGGGSGVDTDETMPWLRKNSVFDIRAYYNTAKEFLLRPVSAFTRWKPERYFNDALVFLLIFGSLGKILNEYWFYMLTGLIGNIQKSPFENVLTFGASALFTPVGVLAGTFVYSGVTHLMLNIFRGAKKNWHSTFATMAWVSGSVSLFSLIPIVGALIASVWGFISLMIGLKVVHETSSVKAFFALTLPTLIIFALLLFFLFAIVGTTVLLGLSHMMEILQQQGRFPL